MVHTYAKGYRTELELVYEFAKRGWLALRAPRSGKISLPSPDIIAIKQRKILALECKSSSKPFKVSENELKQLELWEKIGGAKCYIAWRLPRKRWYFLELKTVTKNKGNVSIGLCEKYGKTIEEIC
jgi:Holliday junction resolvase